MSLSENKKVQTNCPYCGVGCGMEITLKPSKKSASGLDALNAPEVKVVGSENHPPILVAYVSKGLRQAKPLILTVV